MNQGTEIWQILGDNHVPSLWRLCFSARIVTWLWRRCFSKGPYYVAIISLCMRNRLCPRTSVTHCMTTNKTSFTTHHFPTLRMRTTDKLIDNAGRDCWQHATHDSACVPLDKNKWMTHSSSMEIKKNRIDSVTSDQILFQWQWRCRFPLQERNL